MVGQPIMDKKIKTEWHIISESVRGASHDRLELPNQDAIARSPESDDSLPLILAVSDGHGGAKYFRSAQGAKFAVAAAIEIFSNFQKSAAELSNSLWVKEDLHKNLVDTWRSKVKAHHSDEPFTNEELSLLAEKEGSVAQQTVKNNPVLAYGATILAVMISESCITYLQLGDGDILTVSEQGNTGRAFPVLSKHFANETTSLCSVVDWNDFQFHIDEFSSSSALPALILLSTDGYKNSFSSNEGFCKVGSDLFEMIRSDKVEEIKSDLPGWLEETTQLGSGDDITLGILYHIPFAYELEHKPTIESEHRDHTEGEYLEFNTQSSHCDGSLQSQQPEIWITL
jgi:hypothetical protein